MERVTQQIGEALRKRNSFYTIAVRSTVLPGTLAKLGKIVSEISGKVPEKEFSMTVNPEFLREGSAIDDFRNPPYTLIGTDDENARTILRSLYTHIDAPIIMESVNMAEMFKYVNNTWHALKIAFANEIASANIRELIPIGLLNSSL